MLIAARTVLYAALVAAVALDVYWHYYNPLALEARHLFLTCMFVASCSATIVAASTQNFWERFVMIVIVAVLSSITTITALLTDYVDMIHEWFERKGGFNI